MATYTIKNLVSCQCRIITKATSLPEGTLTYIKKKVAPLMKSCGNNLFKLHYLLSLLFVGLASSGSLKKITKG